jgi:hypothetical protein
MGLGTELGDLAKAANPIEAVLSAANTLIDRLVPDRNAAEKAKEELAKFAAETQAKEDSDNRDINKIEAANPSLFVAGARPALLWICDIAIFCYYVPYILVATILWAALVWKTGELQPRPDLGIADLLGLVATILGSSALRSLDKANGVATTAIRWFGPRKAS